MATSLVIGQRELHDTLGNRAPAEARKLGYQTVLAVAGRVRDGLRRRIAKRTRAAEKSIYTRRGRGSTPDAPIVDVRGGATAPYLIMLEFGTKKTRAQPYITPEVEETRPQLPEIYREEFVKKLVKSIAKAAKAEAMA